MYTCVKVIDSIGKGLCLFLLTPLKQRYFRLKSIRTRLHRTSTMVYVKICLLISF